MPKKAISKRTAIRKILWYESQPYGVVYAGKTAYVYKPENDDDTPTDIVVKDGTFGISKCAFYYCKSLKNITIPESVTNIGDFPFDKFENKMTYHLLLNDIKQFTYKKI